MTSSPEKIGLIVSKIDRLKQLTDVARQLGHLDRLFQSCLPPNLRAFVRVAAVRDGCLILQAENSAIATDLRYRTPELLEKVDGIQAFSGVRSIRIRKRQAELARELPRRARVLSNGAADSIIATANDIQDEALSGALRRIAAHRKPEKS